MAEIKSIAVVGYQNASEQDTITPLEIFRGAKLVLNGTIAPWKIAEPTRQLDVKLVSIEPGNITMQTGTQVVPDAVLGDNDLFDIFYVPGGVGSGAMTQNHKLISAVKRHHAAGKVIGANCSGVGVVHRAGILGKTPVTAVAAVVRGMRAEGTNVPQPRRMWQGDPETGIWTATGSYGINGATVAMVAHYFGREVGTIVSMMFDTYGGIGEYIYELQGPEFYYHPELEPKFQDYFEPMLLPKPKQEARR